MRILPLPVLMLAFLASLASCRGQGPAAGGPTLERIQREIFDRSCVASGCHFGPRTESGLSLVSGRTHRSLVGVRSTQIRDLMLVVPYRSGESYLVRKLEGSGIVGERMPQGREPLPEDEIALIRQWIDRGAPDD